MAAEKKTTKPVRFELDPRQYPGWPGDLDRVAEAMHADVLRAAALQERDAEGKAGGEGTKGG